MPTLIGPFSQALTMSGLPEKGPIKDKQLPLISNAGIIVEDGKIVAIGNFDELPKNMEIIEILSPHVLLPGFIDAHTHLCYAGNRAGDYALRLSGKTYQEIAASGGGILDTVRKTRAADAHQLSKLLEARLKDQLSIGITTTEVKSGYGLSVEEELKMLRVIKKAAERYAVIPTCLAAHTLPIEFSSCSDYLNEIIHHLLPIIISEKLTHRIDIFVEKGAFSVEEARPYLKKCQELSFSIVIHADQFTRGASRLAAEIGALSADHLEQTTVEDAKLLKERNVIPIVLPGCSLGLGIPFPPARMLLDADLPLVIASDWNPGTAPMGNLLTQAALLGAAQKLTMAETLAGITTRAAKALQLSDRGALITGKLAHLIAFPCKDYREILYHQGSLKPSWNFI